MNIVGMCSSENRAQNGSLNTFQVLMLSCYSLCK